MPWFVGFVVSCTRATDTAGAIIVGCADFLMASIMRSVTPGRSCLDLLALFVRRSPMLVVVLVLRLVAVAAAFDKTGFRRPAERELNKAARAANLRRSCCCAASPPSLLSLSLAVVSSDS